MPRRPGTGDEGFMPAAMLVTIVAVGLSVLIASFLGQQATAVKRSAEAPRAFNAAQAGLESAVGRIRLAADVSGNGLRAKLPCGPYTGRVSPGDPYTFTVTLTYRSVGGTALTCTAGSGVATTPVYVDLSSTGADPAVPGGRTLTARYSLSTTNQNIPGGLIHVWPVSGSPDLCMDAGSAVPAVGTAVTVKACTQGTPAQTWAYTDELELRLVSSQTDARPLGLCLDAGPTPHPASDVVAAMQPCQAVSPYRQRWAMNNYNNFEGTDGTNLDSHCLNVQFPGQDGSRVLLRTGGTMCEQVGTNSQNWSPDAGAGAGAAGPKLKQLVNYSQFGRCLDVPGFQTNSASLWAWPCKQDPDGNLSWNQEWTTAVPTAAGTTGTITTEPSAGNVLCLRSPLVATPQSYPNLATCSSVSLAARSWTMYGDTGLYRTSYTIVDGAGSCLAVEDPAAPGAQRYLGRISSVVVEACNGSTRQKWNADPNVLRPSPLTDIREK